MTLFPKKFCGAEEKSSSKLPTYNIAPLVDLDGEVAVGLHPFGIHRADDGLTRRTHNQGLFERACWLQAALRTGLKTVVSHHRALFRKPFDMLRLFFQKAHGNEKRKISIPMSCFLELAVQGALHIFPKRVAPRLNHHAATYRRNLSEIRCLDDLLIPLWIIIASCGGDCRFLFGSHICARKN